MERCASFYRQKPAPITSPRPYVHTYLLSVRGCDVTNQRCCFSVSPKWFRKCSDSRHSRNIAPQAAGLSTLSVSALKSQSRQVGAGGWAAILSFIAGLSYSVYWLATSSKEKAPIESESQDLLEQPDGYESEAYRVVLASVRQNITFQRALQSMREGDTSRAVVELHRVLEHNAICRKAINLEFYAEKDLEDVYRLHLQNSELPLQYSTLLHLRQLLSLSDEKAEGLEGDLKSSAYAFSI